MKALCVCFCNLLERKTPLSISCSVALGSFFRNGEVPAYALIDAYGFYLYLIQQTSTKSIHYNTRITTQYLVTLQWLK
jgi:hypothetical protein